MVSFPEAVTLFFKRYVDFQGRSRRSEYWWPFLMVLIANIAFFVLIVVFSSMGDAGVMLFGLLNLIYMVFFLAIIIPSIAVSIRRLHDRDLSGWWYLLSFVPFGGFVLLYFFVQDGTPGPNQYGPDPKGGLGPTTAATFE